MIRAATVTACLWASAATAQMDDMQAMSAAMALGSVLAAEQFCDLTYDQDAIAAHIAKTVPPERMDFANTLQTMTMGAEFNQQSMSASSKTAHCAAIRQSATHFGFIR